MERKRTYARAHRDYFVVNLLQPTWLLSSAHRKVIKRYRHAALETRVTEEGRAENRVTRFGSSFVRAKNRDIKVRRKRSGNRFLGRSVGRSVDQWRSRLNFLG